MGLYGKQQWYVGSFDGIFLFNGLLLVRTRFGSRAKFEMIEVEDEPIALQPTASSFPKTAPPPVTSAVTKAQKKKLSKKK